MTKIYDIRLEQGGQPSGGGMDRDQDKRRGGQSGTEDDSEQTF